MAQSVPSPLLLLILISLSLSFIESEAHVRLLFPPARDNNDFLDSFNTDSPCGVMHTKSSPVTTLAAGMALNVSWRMTYAHKGGFSVEFLRPLNRTSPLIRGTNMTVLQVLKPQGTLAAAYEMIPLTNETLISYGMLANPSAQWVLVQLPDEECQGCTIRLKRQAFDLGGAGLTLWSCGDVNIKRTGVNACHGCSGGAGPCVFNIARDRWECSCPTTLPLQGSYCERREECVVDSDCGEVYGKCIDIGSPNPPTRQCFCQEGWHGPACNIKSQLSLDPEVNLTLWEKDYDFHINATNFDMFWKIIPAPRFGNPNKDGRQIEVALFANTTSYTAVGWRPITTEFRPIPNIDPRLNTPMNGPPAPPLPFWTPPPLPPPVPAPAPSPFSPTPAPDLAPGVQGPDPQTRRVLVEEAPPPFDEFSRRLAEQKGGGVGGMRGKAEAPAPGPAPAKPVVRGGVVIERQMEGNSYAALMKRTGKIPGMYLQDMTIGSARGNFHRVVDAWTYGSHASPILDTVLGGVNDILDATGHEEPGQGTFIKFRRPFVPSDNDLDYTIPDGDDVTVVWAYGQAPGKVDFYGSSAATLYLKQQAENFYRPDDLLYHSAQNRGEFGDMNLILGAPTLDAKKCKRSTLKAFACMYKLGKGKLVLHWALVRGQVSIAVVAKTKGWIAIGWSKDGSMIGTNAVIGQPGRGGRAGTVGTFRLVGKSGRAVVGPDPAFSILTPTISHVRGSTFMSFSRSLGAQKRLGGVPLNIGANKTNYIVWAMSDDDSSSLAYHRITNRGVVSLNMVTGKGREVANSEIWYQVHGVIMSLALAILSPLGAVSARFGRTSHPKRREFYHGVHVILQVLSVLTVTGSAIIGVFKFIGRPFGPVKQIHGMVGAGILALLWIQALFALFLRPHKISKARTIWTIVHFLLGWGIMAGGAFNAYLGLLKFHDLTGANTLPYLVTYGVCLAVLVGIYVVLCLCRRPWEIQPEPKYVAGDYDIVEASKRRALPAGRGRGLNNRPWPPPGVEWPTHKRRGSRTAQRALMHKDDNSPSLASSPRHSVSAPQEDDHREGNTGEGITNNASNFQTSPPPGSNITPRGLAAKRAQAF